MDLQWKKSKLMNDLSKMEFNSHSSLVVDVNYSTH